MPEVAQNRNGVWSTSDAGGEMRQVFVPMCGHLRPACAGGVHWSTTAKEGGLVLYLPQRMQYRGPENRFGAIMLVHKHEM